MTFRLIILFMIHVSISGCATTGRPNLPQEISTSEIRKEGYALIIGSLSRQNAAAIYDRWGINVRLSDVPEPVDFKIEGKASTTAPFIAYDFDYREDKFSGNIFAYLVPAGTYEIYDYTLFQTRGAFYRHWSPEGGLSIPLIIKENTITYIGEYAATANYEWEIFDNRSRDLDMLKQRYPDLDWSSLVISVPQTKKFK